jgi:hypothetical protein
MSMRALKSAMDDAQRQGAWLCPERPLVVVLSPWLHGDAWRQWSHRQRREVSARIGEDLVHLLGAAVVGCYGHTQVAIWAEPNTASHAEPLFKHDPSSYASTAASIATGIIQRHALIDLTLHPACRVFPPLVRGEAWYARDRTDAVDALMTHQLLYEQHQLGNALMKRDPSFTFLGKRLDEMRAILAHGHDDPLEWERGRLAGEILMPSAPTNQGTRALSVVSHAWRLAGIDPAVRHVVAWAGTTIDRRSHRQMSEIKAARSRALTANDEADTASDIRLHGPTLDVTIDDRDPAEVAAAMPVAGSMRPSTMATSMPTAGRAS